MEPGRKPPNRLDAEGRRQIAPTWEAMEAGEFDDLPFRGERLPLVDDTYAGDRAMAFHVLRNAGVAPPWIEADKEIRALLARRDAILARAAEPSTSTLARRRRRAELEALVATVNAAIGRLNAEAPTDRQHRRPLVLADELAGLDALSRG
jgi:hypothetical protein